MQRRPKRQTCEEGETDMSEQKTTENDKPEQDAPARLPEGGRTLESAMAEALKEAAARRVGGRELMDILDESRLGNDPEIIKLLAGLAEKGTMR